MPSFLVCCGREVSYPLTTSKPVMSVLVLREIVKELVLDEVTVRSDGDPPPSYSSNHLHTDDTPRIVKLIYEAEKDL